MSKPVLSKPSAIQSGFTLIELMVTLAVLTILMVMAIPAFTDFRQRAAVRGAADQIVSFWADARFEAVRRNELVKVGFVDDGAGAYCIGAATTTDPEDETPCDCMTAAACNVSAFPQDQREWRRIQVPSDTTLGGDSGVVVIDPKRGNITDPDDIGMAFLQSPPGALDYRLNVAIDRNGRAFICQPDTGNAVITQYANRRCQGP